jgi:hypothetical protein
MRIICNLFILNLLRIKNKVMIEFATGITIGFIIGIFFVLAISLIRK